MNLQLTPDLERPKTMHKLTVLAPMAAAFIALLALAPGAWAVDGVIEINHAKALAGGVTASDTPGYPVTIDSTGSYRLTSNLTVPGLSIDGIEVSASSVSIDLNGFEILGVVICSGTPLICSPGGGSSSGVKSLAEAITGISVKNGSITGFGSYGVYLRQHAEVSNLRVRWNRLTGILVGGFSSVSGSKVYENQGVGIDSTFTGSIISGNTVIGNTETGIVTYTFSIVSGNTVSGNAGTGISIYSSSTASGNTVSGNGLFGILAQQGSTVSSNTVSGNGNHGIIAYDGSSVQGNTMRGNSGFGLELGVGSTYRENTITGNTGGTVTGSGVDMGANSCNGSTTCP